MDILDGSLLHYLHMRGHGVLSAGEDILCWLDFVSLIPVTAPHSPLTARCHLPAYLPPKLIKQRPAARPPFDPLRPAAALLRDTRIKSHRAAAHPPHTLKVTPFTGDSLRKKHSTHELPLNNTVQNSKFTKLSTKRQSAQRSLFYEKSCNLDGKVRRGHNSLCSQIVDEKNMS